MYLVKTKYFSHLLFSFFAGEEKYLHARLFSPFILYCYCNGDIVCMSRLVYLLYFVSFYIARDVLHVLHVSTRIYFFFFFSKEVLLYSCACMFLLAHIVFLFIFLLQDMTYYCCVRTRLFIRMYFILFCFLPREVSHACVFCHTGNVIYY